ncbi:MAG: APC family permease [Candidatus Eiseniibacteriota bacterium]
MTTTSAEPDTPPGLVRGIRRWDLLALMINSTIGAGIFGLPARVHALLGPWSLLALVACGILVAIVILCFAEVASRFERTGGPYLYARTAFGPGMGFVMGWLLWLVRLTSYAALCNLLVSYLHVLWPAADAAPWRTMIIVGVTAALVVINLVGVRGAALTGNAFTLAKLVPIALLVTVGLGALVPERLALGPPPESGALAKGMLLLVFAYTGFELVLIPAGEASDPRRNLPWAMLSGLTVVAAVYVLLQVVCTVTVPDLARSERPLADAATAVLGRVGGIVLAAGAVISITGTLGAIMLAAPRLPFAMAESGELPRALASTHPQFHTPWNAIVLTAACMLGLALSTTFLGALTIGTAIRLLTYVSTCAALLALRRRRDVPEAAFRAPAGGLLAIVALLTCVWLLTSVTGGEARIVAIAALPGLAFYALRRLASGTRRFRAGPPR